MKKIIIYGKRHCPYCSMAQDLLNAKGLEFEYIDADEESKKFLELAKTHNHRTVPMIFIDGEFLGGFDTLNALEKSGSL